jgi:membrane protein implicated in regulation of membrane protease activity
VKEIPVGYGFGAFLLVLGLVLALAVTDQVSGVDLTMVGWIMAIVGVLVIVLTAATLSRARGTRSVATTTHSDGTQTVSERRTEI